MRKSTGGATSPGAGGVASTFRHWKMGGQVPSSDRLQMMKLTETPAKPFNPMQLLDHTEPRMTVDSVLDGLGFDPAQYNSWKQFLQKAFEAENELLMRRDLMSRSMSEKLNPQLRRALFQRSLVHYRGKFQKSMVNVMTLEEYRNLNSRARVHAFYTMTPDQRESFTAQLHKAEAKGGTYHRRVPKAGGKGYTYYYDEVKYNRSKNAHVDGPATAKAQIKKGVSQLMEENKKSCGVKHMKSLVKQYGAKACGDTLKEMQKQDGLTFKDGVFGLAKSERFFIRS